MLLSENAGGPTDKYRKCTYHPDWTNALVSLTQVVVHEDRKCAVDDPGSVVMMRSRGFLGRNRSVVRSPVRVGTKSNRDLPRKGDHDDPPEITSRDRCRRFVERGRHDVAGRYVSRLG